MNSSIIKFYKYGDRIGAPWEGQDYGLHNRSYDEIMGRANNCSDGTDESDIVDCFIQFTENYTYITTENLLVDWLIFQTKNRHSKRYGGTYRDHFRLMEWFLKEGQIDLDKIRKLAKDRNSNGSFGNGCLALVYPVHCYAKQIGQDSIHLVKGFTSLIYTHDYAIRGVTFLHQIIEAAETSTDIRGIKSDDIYVQEFIDTGLDMKPDEYIKKYPDNIMVLHTLFSSLYCAYNAIDEKDVITRCVNFGGDVDSVLATAMLIFALMKVASKHIKQNLKV